ncbi:uncharacterized protein [Diadema antillarum]|uniref:uncharacterized protein n=1 Tax=Diadema antillarum TaxID=105358 RepID=UPI003A84236D
MKQVIAVILVLSLVGSSLADNPRLRKKSARPEGLDLERGFGEAPEDLRAKYERAKSLVGTAGSHYMALRNKFAEEARAAAAMAPDQLGQNLHARMETAARQIKKIGNHELLKSRFQKVARKPQE